MKRWIWAGAIVLLLGVAIGGCNENNHTEFGNGTSTAESSNPGDTPVVAPAAFAVSLEVHDETNAPVAGATVRLGTTEFLTGPDGRITLGGLDQPVVAVIEAPGFFPEPVAIGRGGIGAVVSTQLLRNLGPNGERRVVMHFGGDSMLGRRYTDPDEDGLVRVTQNDGGAQARKVVEALVPLFTAADVRALNFESVIGDLPEAVAYPRKRFLIQSPTATAIPALLELQANVVNLANNHGYDWQDSGVISTRGALGSNGIPSFGVGTTETETAAPLTMTAGGLKIGFLGYTTINGDVINDALPRDSAPVPGDLSANEAWKYELRSFGFVQGAVTIATAPRRAGEAWRLFKAEEDGGLTGANLSAFWSAVHEVYPELQDLVARRGHGGTNAYDSSKVAVDVAALRSSGHDLVVVQLHAGFEYAEQKSSGVEAASHVAIDAGADLFVGHHPHVLNGVEFYKGKLVVHSMGNFFFDQNLFATYSSAMLRVVFEEGNLLQARLYPLTIDDYRPAPVVDQAAEYGLRLLSERSAVPARAERGSDRRVRQVFRTQNPDVQIPDFVRENNSARLVAPVSSATRVAIQLDPGEVFPLPGTELTRSRSASGATLGLELGRDIYSAWGGFEDLTADGIADAETHWSLNTTTHRAEAVADAPDGFGVLRLRRVQSSLGRTTVLPASRAPMLRFRYYDAAGSSYVAATDEARYSLRFHYRLIGEAPLEIRMKFYTFVDPDPFLQPDTRFLREIVIPVSLDSDGAWHTAVIDIPQTAVAPDSDGSEAVFGIPILDFYPSTTPEAILLIDTFQFLEWHTASSMPDGFYGVDAVRSVSGGTAVLTLEQK